MTTARKAFEKSIMDRVASNKANHSLGEAARRFMIESTRPKYSYNFGWLGRPVIQYPQDLVALQEIIWRVKPDLIIETGIAHGGSLIFSASMLALIDLAEKNENFPKNKVEPSRLVIGIDIDIREHNLIAIKSHPFSDYIHMIEGSSVDNTVFRNVKKIAKKYKKVLVILDSNHTHEHVLSELKLFSDLVTLGSYCVVFDTIIECFDADMYPDRPWGPGNSPLSAVRTFLKSSDKFCVDDFVDGKLLISVAPSGYLKRVK